MSEADHQRERKHWMGLLARSRPGALTALWRDFPEGANHANAAGITWLRRPETGIVMVRGRAGAIGDPFNLGEMTITRASLRLPSGTVGHGYVQGRDHEKARIAAMVDALMAGPLAPRVEAAILKPLAADEARMRAARASQAAATQVAFFTMVRGE